MTKTNTDIEKFQYDLIFNLFLEGINVPKPDIPQLIFLIFLISILLIFKKSRFLLK